MHERMIMTDNRNNAFFFMVFVFYDIQMYKVFLIFHKEKNIKTGQLGFKGKSIELNLEFSVPFIEFLRAFCRVFEAKN